MPSLPKNIESMTYADGLALVAKTREKRASVRAATPPLTKEAAGEGLKELWSKLTTGAGDKYTQLMGLLENNERLNKMMTFLHENKNITYPLLGALAGGTVGGLSSLRQDRERRRPLSRALTGALLGGMGTAAVQQAWPWLSGVPSKTDRARAAEHAGLGIDPQPPVTQADADIIGKAVPQTQAHPYLRYGTSLAAGVPLGAAGYELTRRGLEPLRWRGQLRQTINAPDPKKLVTGGRPEKISIPKFNVTDMPLAEGYDAAIDKAIAGSKTLSRLQRTSPAAARHQARVIVDRAIMQPDLARARLGGTSDAGLASVARRQTGGWRGRLGRGAPVAAGLTLAALPTIYAATHDPYLQSLPQRRASARMRSAFQATGGTMPGFLRSKSKSSLYRSGDMTPNEYALNMTLARLQHPELRNEPEMRTLFGERGELPTHLLKPKQVPWYRLF